MSRRNLLQPLWAVCGAGRVGRVTHWDEKEDMFYGERLEGGKWQSSVPQFLHPDTQAELETRWALDQAAHV